MVTRLWLFGSLVGLVVTLALTLLYSVVLCTYYVPSRSRLGEKALLSIVTLQHYIEL